MHGTKEIIKEAEALPVEERVMVVDSLLRTLNRPNAEIDRKWIAAVKRRLTELRSGRVKPVSGYQVFTEVRERFEK